MEFRVPGFNGEMQHNQVYPALSGSSSSNYTNFFNQATEGGQACLKEAIQRELEKEMIREKIIAEEVERFHVLEAEVRRELMIGREMMAMKIGIGNPSSFMQASQPGEIRQTSTLPEARLPSPSLPATGGSTELKKKIEWKCSICKISASSERGLLEHLAGQKHHAKAASIGIKNSPKRVSSFNEKMEWRCPICDVSAPCERGLLDHLAGKKHEAKVTSLKADYTDTELLEKRMEWTWICPICKIDVKSESNLRTHFAGRKHKAAIWAVIRKGKNI